MKFIAVFKLKKVLFVWAFDPSNYEVIDDSSGSSSTTITFSKNYALVIGVSASANTLASLTYTGSGTQIYYKKRSSSGLSNTLMVLQNVKANDTLKGSYQKIVIGYTE